MGATNKGTATHSVAAGTYTITVSGGGANTYINSENTTSASVTVAAGQTKSIRVITQDGTRSPYVTIIKIVGA